MNYFEAEQALAKIAGQDANRTQSIRVDTFLECLAGIAHSRSTARDDFVARTSERVHACAEALSQYLIGIENTLFDSEWVADEWLSVCRRRSHIEDLLALYRDTFSETELLLWLDTEHVDESIAERREVEGPVKAADIPPEMPARHWWWWHPGEPPADRA